MTNTISIEEFLALASAPMPGQVGDLVRIEFDPIPYEQGGAMVLSPDVRKYIGAKLAVENPGTMIVEFLCRDGLQFRWELGGVWKSEKQIRREAVRSFRRAQVTYDPSLEECFKCGGLKGRLTPVHVCCACPVEPSPRGTLRDKRPVPRV